MSPYSTVLCAVELRLHTATHGLRYVRFIQLYIYMSTVSQLSVSLIQYYDGTVHGSRYSTYTRRFSRTRSLYVVQRTLT